MILANANKRIFTQNWMLYQKNRVASPPPLGAAELFLATSLYVVWNYSQIVIVKRSEPVIWMQVLRRQHAVKYPNGRMVMQMGEVSIGWDNGMEVDGANIEREKVDKTKDIGEWQRKQEQNPELDLTDQGVSLVSANKCYC